MNTPLIFKYRYNGHDIVFEGSISSGSGNQIMIQYNVFLDNEFVNSLRSRAIKDSAEESSYRMCVATNIFASLRNDVSHLKRDSKKSVSFAKDKIVQEYIGEKQQSFANVNGQFVGGKYHVPLDTKVVKR